MGHSDDTNVFATALIITLAVAVPAADDPQLVAAPYQGAQCDAATAAADAWHRVHEPWHSPMCPDGSVDPGHPQGDPGHVDGPGTGAGGGYPSGGQGYPGGGQGYPGGDQGYPGGGQGYPSSGSGTGTSPAPSSGWTPRVVPPPTPAVVVTTPFDPATAPAGLYVDCTAGDDAGPGTALRPWRTLAALSRPVVAGTAIFLRRGCQWDGGLTIGTVTTGAPSVIGPAAASTVAGAATNPVPGVPETVVSGYGPGVAPLISAVGLGRNSAVLEVAGTAVTVRGLHLAHAPGFGVNVTGPNALLDGVEVDDVGIGIRIQAPFATVTGGVIHDLHMYNNTPGRHRQRLRRDRHRQRHHRHPHRGLGPRRRHLRHRHRQHHPRRQHLQHHRHRAPARRHRQLTGAAQQPLHHPQRHHDGLSGNP